jgi:PAS domain-containing protein
MLEQDSRPTFIIALQPLAPIASCGMNIVFCNKSLQAIDYLRELLLADPVSSCASSSSSSIVAEDQIATDVVEFREWATTTDSILSNEGYNSSHTFRELLWTSVTLRDRWRLISTSHIPSQAVGTTTCSRLETLDPDNAKLRERSEESLLEFKALAERAPVGMCYLSLDGDIIYANESCESLSSLHWRVGLISTGDYIIGYYIPGGRKKLESEM